jgi:uncharacterized protein (TIGR02246 family)
MSTAEPVESLYRTLLGRWNEPDAAGFGELFALDGSMVGFDDTSVETPARIIDHLTEVFTDHQTASYVAKVREVRSLDSRNALLRAVAGMVPPGEANLAPAVNAIHVLVAVESSGGWRVAHFQNTPAAYDGRPQAVQELTDELRALLHDEPV